MNWFTVITGFALMAGALVGWYRFMRFLKGDDGGSGTPPDSGKRRRARDAAGPNELEQIIAAHRTGAPAVGPTLAKPAATPPAPTSPAPTSPAPGLVVVPGAQPSAATAPADMATASPALLSGGSKLAYLLFRAALPECHVFARVTLAELVRGPAPTHTFALVICRSDFTILAAVDVAPPAERPPAPAVALARAGIRHVLIDPKSMPRRTDVRSLVGADQGS
jgi:hypothetical protein